MQVSVENTGILGRRLTITVPATEVQSVVDVRMNEVAKNAKIDGFRPGKIPKQIIQQKFGAQIRQEAVSKVIENSLPEALQKESLLPAGRPLVEEVFNLDEADKDLQYIVSFEIFPEFSLPDFTSFEVEKYEIEISDQDVEKTLEKVKSQVSTWTPVNRAADENDRLTVDYTSTINGKPYENNVGRDVLVEMGSKLFIEGFELGLLGLRAGETQELDLTFPENWRLEKIAGKPVHFSIFVKEVAEKTPVTMEDVAKRLGVEGADLSAIKAKVRENMAKQMNHEVDENIRKKILDQLIEKCPIPLPKALVENEIHNLHEDLHRRMGDKGTEACHHQGLEEEANRRVTLSLLLRNLVKSKNLKPDNEKVRQKIKEISKSFGNAEFIEKMYYESEELIAGVQNTVLVDQAIDIILAEVKLIPKAITFEAFLKELQGAGAAGAAGAAAV